jgi:TetR/AcrR family transcriptional regulator, transcriptional repressor for nem operon
MDVRDAILTSAEVRMRGGGFHGCSFREIAGDVGIKSASVYYHFATKAELGAAMVARYEARVLAAVGDPEDDRELEAKLDGMRAAFRAGLARGDGMCLCGVLAAETHSLPPLVVAATRHYFAACNEWIRRALAYAGSEGAPGKAVRLTALLQGAMLQAIAFDDVAVYDAAVEGFHGVAL